MQSTKIKNAISKNAAKTAAETNAENKKPVALFDVERRIVNIRGHRVLLDSDLAQLDDVPTKSLNLAVHRNPDRFPEDFVFRLTTDEWHSVNISLRFHIETSSGVWKIAGSVLVAIIPGNA